VRSYAGGDGLLHISADDGPEGATLVTWCLICCRGGMTVERVRQAGPEHLSPGEPRHLTHWMKPANGAYAGTMQGTVRPYSFHFVKNDQADDNDLILRGFRGRMWALVFPLWVPLVIFAVPPILWLAGKVKRRVGGRGESHTRAICGYDLRGTRDRCPECGHIADSQGIT